MKNVYLFATVFALAFGQVSADEVDRVGPAPDQVDQQSIYDIGVDVEDKDAEPVAVETPEGKADKIVVISGPGCHWCVVYKTNTLSPLKLQDYVIETYDVGDDESLAQLKAKYSNIKHGNDKAVNYYRASPTTFYIRGDKIIKKEEGYRTIVQVRETLWKPGSEIEQNPIEKVRRQLPWNK